MNKKQNLNIIYPNIDEIGLTKNLFGFNALGEKIELPVVTEKPMTIYLNSNEIVTAMTLGDWPKEMAVGFLYNQNFIKTLNEIETIDYDDDLSVVVVRTKKHTNYEIKLKKQIRTSGCAQGTIYADIMEKFKTISLNKSIRITTNQLFSLSKKINEVPSLYLKAGAIHGCVLCNINNPLIFMEDIGRHNAVDKISGYMFLNKISGYDKVFYTTGRLTTEMIIKTVMMKIPILVSRSGFTEAGVELARKSGLTLIGRAKGKRLIVLSGKERVIFEDFDRNLYSKDVEEIASAQREIQGDKRI